jgi:hypothetical protein
MRLTFFYNALEKTEKYFLMFIFNYLYFNFIFDINYINKSDFK